VGQQTDDDLADHERGDQRERADQVATVGVRRDAVAVARVVAVAGAMTVVVVVVLVVVAVVVESVAVLVLVAHGSLLGLVGRGRAEPRTQGELYRNE
jgi:hypothetical protein